MKTSTILVVEDENIVAKDLQNRLKRLGYAVPELASSGEEAIRKAATSRPDLVLMDIGLRGKIDGIEAAQQIYTRLRIPVVFLTAYADDSTIRRAKIVKPFGYIGKPLEDQELYTILNNFFARSSRKLK